jgi:hypothetical protein
MVARHKPRRHFLWALVATPIGFTRLLSPRRDRLLRNVAYQTYTRIVMAVPKRSR